MNLFLVPNLESALKETTAVLNRPKTERVTLVGDIGWGHVDDKFEMSVID